MLNNDKEKYFSLAFFEVDIEAKIEDNAGLILSVIAKCYYVSLGVRDEFAFFKMPNFLTYCFP